MQAYLVSFATPLGSLSSLRTAEKERTVNLCVQTQCKDLKESPKTLRQAPSPSPLSCQSLSPSFLN